MDREREACRCKYCIGEGTKVRRDEMMLFNFLPKANDSLRYQITDKPLAKHHIA